MESLITPANIMFVLGILAVIFSVYNSFHKPQEELETKQALSVKDLDSKATVLAQKEMENKAALLAQQVLSEKESNERRFKEMNDTNIAAMTLAQNHIHTVDMKVEVLTKTIGEMNNSIGNELTRLATILEERLPKKVI